MREKSACRSHTNTSFIMIRWRFDGALRHWYFICSPAKYINQHHQQQQQISAVNTRITSTWVRKANETIETKRAINPILFFFSISHSLPLFCQFIDKIGKLIGFSHQFPSRSKSLPSINYIYLQHKFHSQNENAWHKRTRSYLQQACWLFCFVQSFLYLYFMFLITHLHYDTKFNLRRC